MERASPRRSVGPSSWLLWAGDVFEVSGSGFLTRAGSAIAVVGKKRVGLRITTASTGDLHCAASLRFAASFGA